MYLALCLHNGEPDDDIIAQFHKAIVKINYDNYAVADYKRIGRKYQAKFLPWQH